MIPYPKERVELPLWRTAIVSRRAALWVVLIRKSQIKIGAEVASLPFMALLLRWWAVLWLVSRCHGSTSLPIQEWRRGDSFTRFCLDNWNPKRHLVEVRHEMSRSHIKECKTVFQQWAWNPKTWNYVYTSRDGALILLLVGFIPGLHEIDHNMRGVYQKYMYGKYFMSSSQSSNVSSLKVKLHSRFCIVN